MECNHKDSAMQQEITWMHRTLTWLYFSISSSCPQQFWKTRGCRWRLPGRTGQPQGQCSSSNRSLSACEVIHNTWLQMGHPGARSEEVSGPLPATGQPLRPCTTLEKKQERERGRKGIEFLGFIPTCWEIFWKHVGKDIEVKWYHKRKGLHEKSWNNVARGMVDL